LTQPLECVFVTWIIRISVVLVPSRSRVLAIILHRFSGTGHVWRFRQGQASIWLIRADRFVNARLRSNVIRDLHKAAASCSDPAPLQLSTGRFFLQRNSQRSGTRRRYPGGSAPFGNSNTNPPASKTRCQPGSIDFSVANTLVLSDLGRS